MEPLTGASTSIEVRTAIIQCLQRADRHRAAYIRRLESVHGSIEKLDADDFLHIIEESTASRELITRPIHCRPADRAPAAGEGGRASPAL